MSIFLIL